MGNLGWLLCTVAGGKNQDGRHVWARLMINADRFFYTTRDLSPLVPLQQNS
jgi:hypothetical protein